MVDSYAGYEGESVTLHSIVDRGLAGQRVDPDWPIYRNGGLLLFHAEGEEAQRLCFRGTSDDAAAYYADQRETLRPGAFLRLARKQAGNRIGVVHRSGMVGSVY